MQWILTSIKVHVTQISDSSVRRDGTHLESQSSMAAVLGGAGGG